MNIDYYKIKEGHFTLWLSPAFKNPPLKDLLTEGLYSLTKAYPARKIPASAASEVYVFELKDKRFYFKQYHCRSAWDFFKHIFRPSRAERAMRAAAMLETNGFAAPEVAAAGCSRKGVFRLENFLISREVENSVPVYNFFDKNYGAKNTNIREKRHFIKTLGRLIGTLHAKNISHGDLRLGNVLVRAAVDRPQGWDFFFIDNERTVKFRRLPGRLRLKNLVQCNMYLHSAITNTDRVRFFKAYMAENPKIADTQKKLAVRVYKKTQKRLSAAK